MLKHVKEKSDWQTQSKDPQPQVEVSKLEGGGGAICEHLGVNYCPAFQTEMYIQVT